MKTFIKSLIIATAAFASLGASASTYAAGNANLYLSPSSASVNNGETFSVAVAEDGDAVTVVTVDYIYDSSKFQFIGATCSGQTSPLSETANKISCFAKQGTTLSGYQTIGTLTFKAISDAGTGMVSTVDSSKIVTNNQDIWNHSAKSAAISISTPAPAAPITPGRGGGTTTQPTSDTATNSSNATQNSSDTTSIVATIANDDTASADADIASPSEDAAAVKDGSEDSDTSNSVAPANGDNTTKGDSTPYVVTLIVALAALIGAVTVGSLKRPELFPAAASAIDSIKSFLRK